MNAVTEVAPLVGIVMACVMLAVARATYYRSLRPRILPPARPTPPRALGPGERQAVLDVLHEPRFVDLAPVEVYASLLVTAPHRESRISPRPDDRDMMPRGHPQQHAPANSCRSS